MACDMGYETISDVDGDLLGHGEDKTDKEAWEHIIEPRIQPFGHEQSNCNT